MASVCDCRRQQQELLEAGDGSQVYCDSCYTESHQPSAGGYFPTLNEMKEAPSSDTIPFKSVKDNIVYRIIAVKTISTRFGDAMILTMKDTTGAVVKCFASSLLYAEMKRLMTRETYNEETQFITKFGVVVSGKESGNTYHKYKLVSRKSE